MMKIQHLAIILIPAFFIGCQEIEGEKDTSLVYFFTDQDGSKVPLKEEVKSSKNKKVEEEPKGFITRTDTKKKESNKEKKGGLFSFWDRGEKKSEKSVASTKKETSPSKTSTSSSTYDNSTVKLETPDITGDLQYPSIVEPEKAQAAKEVPLAKPYKILDLGEEKIRVIDRQMGSVEAEDVKKLRAQGNN